ncbi:MAG TPA: DUF3090 domain-containing protein [Micromonosporaceae bacterium]|jgi:uncharacterized repeat protein (TIGR03847 family)
MGPHVYEFEPPERFVAGTVGEPGDRTFFLQARGKGQTVSVVLEKVQVAMLADKLEELLIEAANRFGVELPSGDELPQDNEPLETPVEEEFRVGTLGLSWDVDSGTVVIEAIAAPEADQAAQEGAESDEADLDRLRVRLTPEETRAFIDRARRLVAAGRPPCPLCGNPLDPSGHLCPRHNGYRR